MIWLLRYWKPLAGIVLVGGALGGMYWWGYSTKAMACDLAAMSLENAQIQAQRAEIAYWQEQAHKADEAARKAKEANREAVRKAKENTRDRDQAIDAVPVSGACVRPHGLPRLDEAADAARAAAGH